MLFAALLIQACQPQQPAEESTAPKDDASQTQSVETQASTPFCLELLSARGELLLGEPLTLLASLRNCSDESREVRELLQPEYGILNVTIDGPQSDDTTFFNPAVRRDGRGRGYAQLEPGEAIHATVPVYFGSDGWQLSEPGSYRFKAQYTVDDLELTSNEVVVHIKSPPGPEVEVSESLMSDNAASFYYLGGGNEESALALQSVIAEHPGSTWADHASLALAIDASQSSDDCALLEAVLRDSRTDWISAWRGLDELTQCLEYQERDSDISRVVGEFLVRHPQARNVVGARYSGDGPSDQ